MNDAGKLWQPVNSGDPSKGRDAREAFYVDGRGDSMNKPPQRTAELFLSAARSYQRPFWQPAVDAYQTPHGWLLKYELAGVSPDEVEVLLAGNIITVQGVRRDLRIEENRQSFCMEISYNRFERTLKLPCELNTMRVATQYRDGMLLVQLTCQENER